MWLDDQKLQARYILHDRDSKFSAAFDQLFRDAGVQVVHTPRLAPDANAFVEAWIGSFKRECLNHFMCFGLGHLDHISQEYASFFNAYRPHQGLGNWTIPIARAGPVESDLSVMANDLHRIRCQRILGGLLRHYYRAA
jgi:putative transposase